MKFYFYRSEQGIHLPLEVIDENDVLVDLAGATVTFRMAPRHGPLVLEKTCIHNSLGIVEVVFGPGDLDQKGGWYRMQWRYEKGGVAQILCDIETAIREDLFHD